MISVSHSVRYAKLKSYLKGLTEINAKAILERYGKRGVAALKAATPQNSGKTAESWSYEVHTANDSASLIFKNDNVNNGTPVVILLQYGHATKNGGFVQGKDFINPALAPIFDEIAKAVREEVKR